MTGAVAPRYLPTWLLHEHYDGCWLGVNVYLLVGLELPWTEWLSASICWQLHILAITWSSIVCLSVRLLNHWAKLNQTVYSYTLDQCARGVPGNSSPGFLPSVRTTTSDYSWSWIPEEQEESKYVERERPRPNAGFPRQSLAKQDCDLYSVL